MRCTLYGFITDYVKDIFIEEILFDIREKLTEVTLGKMKCQDNMQYYREPFLVLLTKETTFRDISVLNETKAWSVSRARKKCKWFLLFIFTLLTLNDTAIYVTYIVQQITLLMTQIFSITYMYSAPSYITYNAVIYIPYII